MNFNLKDVKWFNPPRQYKIENEKVTIITDPKTDFWQRTYYGFKNDNAHVLYNKTNEQFFSFSVKVQFSYKDLFDQCGIAIYQDSENWVKGGIEYHNDRKMWLGSVVTNHGYSDWATVDIDASISSIWYRLSRRQSDYLIEYSYDGIDFQQMRIFHLAQGAKEINFGLIACSPSDSSFEAIFTDMKITDCMWKAHGM